jgi:hypothetical protein
VKSRRSPSVFPADQGELAAESGQEVGAHPVLAVVVGGLGGVVPAPRDAGGLHQDMPVAQAVRRDGTFMAKPLEHGHIPCGTSFVVRMPNDRRFLKAALARR